MSKIKLCAHYDWGRCNILNKDKLDCDKCSFHITPEQIKQGQAKTYVRLAGLPKYRQRHIADTYYRGDMPWRKGQI